MRYVTILMSLMFAASSHAAAEVWPQGYLWEDGAEFELVVLYADGTAVYAEKETRSGNGSPYFVSSTVQWEACNPDFDRLTAECISLGGAGFNGAEQESFGVMFNRRGGVLRTYTATGFGHVLKRIAGR